MNKQNRKLEFTVAIIFIILVGGFTFLLDFSNGMCGNESYKEIYSPNKSLKAVIFTRGCGATTGYGTQVAILGHAEELKNTSEAVFSVEGHATTSSPIIKWINNKHLNIRKRPNRQAYLAENTWGWFETVEITYNN